LGSWHVYANPKGLQAQCPQAIVMIVQCSIEMREKARDERRHSAGSIPRN
jgi:hypothetical protein